MNYETLGETFSSQTGIVKSNGTVIYNREIPPFSGTPRNPNDIASRIITARVKRESWGYASTALFDHNYDNNPIKGVKSLENAFFLASSQRLLVRKFIPRNEYEVSKTYTTSENRYGAIFRKYYPEFWELPFWSVDDYFATLQFLMTSDTNLMDYFFLLTFPDILCGVPLKDEYNDPDITPFITKYKIPFEKIHYANSPAVNSRYANFWQHYEDWGVNRFLRHKIISRVLEQSRIMQDFAHTLFDIDSLGAYINAINSTLTNDSKVNEGYIDALVNMPHSIKFDAEYPGDEKGAQPWYNIGRRFSTFAGGKYVPMVKQIWKDAILPAKIQLNAMVAQWNRLKTNNPPITDTELATIFDVTKNIFLAYDEKRTEEMKQVIVSNLGRSPLTEGTARQVALPGLQYMYEPVTHISESLNKYFTPLYSYSAPGVPQRSSGGDNGTGDKNGSLIPLIVAGVIAAGAYYYSTR